MKASKNGDQNELNINMGSRRMEEVNAYRYLGVDVTNDGKMNEEVNHRIVLHINYPQICRSTFTFKFSRGWAKVDKKVKISKGVLSCL